MLVDRNGRSLSSADLFRDQANKAVIGPGANVYANGISIAGMTPRKYMEQAQALYYRNPWIRTAEGIISKKLSTMDWHLAIHTEEEDEEPPVTSGPAWDFLDLGSPLQGLSRSKLWGITSRHMGLCNNGFWYPDRKQPENGCIYINPCRVTPVPTDSGYLAYWLIDADDYGNDGVRFEKDELLWFQLEAADVGFFGHGLVYSALTKAMLSAAADNHALQTLESGGRLQGILTPKADEFLNDFQFASVQRELRNVTEMDDSAKRMVLLRKAVEFTATTMRPNELELPLLMRTTKEDIYEIWGVPRSQTGGMTEVGMNSGDRQSYEEAALQQNAIHPRLVVFEETVRTLLRTFDPRYELEFEEPEFDDERPLYEMLKMSEFAPMSRNERRKLIKLPPLKDEVGKVVEQNPGLLQIDPPLPIARSMITGRLQDGSTVEQPGIPQDTQGRVDAINRARGAPKQSATKGELDVELSKAIAERIIEKAEHFLAKPGDMDMIAPQKLVTRVLGSADLLREVHDGLKAIIATGQANDWAVEEYAEAVRGAALVPDHLAHAASVMSAPSPAFADVLRAAGDLAVTSERKAALAEQRQAEAEQRLEQEQAAMKATLAAELAQPSWAEQMRSEILQSVAKELAAKPPRRFEPQRDKDGRIVAIQEVGA
jgi:phage portal protein BeeE